MLTGCETILLVEDAEPFRKLVRMLLESSGYTVLEAGNCAEAAQLAARHHGRNDRSHQLAGRAFDDDIGRFGQRLDRQGGWLPVQLVQPRAVLVYVLRGYRRELQAVYPSSSAFASLDPIGPSPAIATRELPVVMRPPKVFC